MADNLHEHDIDEQVNASAHHVTQLHDQYFTYVYICIHRSLCKTEELEALQAIYGDAVIVVPVGGTAICRCVSIDIAPERSKLHGTLEVPW